MAVAKLYVEGDLDRQLFVRLLAGLPGVASAGGKDLARQKTARERGNGLRTYYLRDRDFDYDPTYRDEARPLIEYDQVMGWYWSRHEIENYLLEPQLLARAFGGRVTAEEVEQELLAAAQRIRFYQMARWAVGRVRRFQNFPNPRKIQTKHPSCPNDYQLPVNMDYGSCSDWATTSTESFLQTVLQNVNQDAIQSYLAANYEDFTLEKCQDLKWVLHTFSGKDLFGSLRVWLDKKLSLSPKEVCQRLVSWIDENQEEAFAILPEWKNFIDMIRSL
ncbi:MAG TPA: hypothetical protein VFV52_15500 [Bacilli bacterium]|nr:hypothetical protein [Bacilli bacterium]